MQKSPHADTAEKGCPFYVISSGVVGECSHPHPEDISAWRLLRSEHSAWDMCGSMRQHAVARGCSAHVLSVLWLLGHRAAACGCLRLCAASPHSAALIRTLPQFAALALTSACSLFLLMRRVSLRQLPAARQLIILML